MSFGHEMSTQKGAQPIASYGAYTLFLQNYSLFLSKTSTFLPSKIQTIMFTSMKNIYNIDIRFYKYEYNSTNLMKNKRIH